MANLFPRFASTFRYYVKRAIAAAPGVGNAALELRADFSNPVEPYFTAFSNIKSNPYNAEFSDIVTAWPVEFNGRESDTLP
jgi:hypothetical protein